VKKEILAVQKEYDGFKMVYDIDYDSATNTLIAASQYGLLKTQDDGLTWDPIPVLSAPGVTALYSVAFNPNDSKNIFYATGNSFNSSIDGGESWISRHLATASKMSEMIVRSAASKADIEAGSSASGIITVMTGFKIPKE
jgi:photosystem II stability/assembly factor-like uncharacterized protein